MAASKLSRALRAARENVAFKEGKRITVVEMSRRTSMSASTLANIERGQRSVSCEYLAELCWLYRSDYCNILTAAGFPTPENTRAANSQKELQDKIDEKEARKQNFRDRRDWSEANGY